MGCAACLEFYLESLFKSISKHLFLTAVTGVYPPDYFFMARGSLELGCPESQGFVDAEQGGHHLNAKRFFRRVHRDHTDAPLTPLAIWTGLANANARSVSSPHSPGEQL